MGAVPMTRAWRPEVAVFMGALIGVATVVAIFALVAPPMVSPGGPTSIALPQNLSAFESDSQLQQYITANAKSAQQYSRWGIGFGGGLMLKGGPVVFGGVANGPPILAAAVSSDSSAASFTQTNVQVQGVDEPDRVKTDGTHLFVSTQNSVSIINAYPPSSAAVLSTLKFPNANVIGLEMTKDRLMVIDQKSGSGVAYQKNGGGIMYQQPSGTSAVELLLYDVSNLNSPKLMQNESIPGAYVAARLADGYVYAVIQQPSYIFSGQGNATAVMPVASNNGTTTQLLASSVFYTNNTAQISYYTIIPSISMATGKENTVTVLTGPSATVYVSTSNIYVVYTNYPDLFSTHNIVGDVYTGGVVSISNVQQAQNSTILRAAYSGGAVVVKAAGIVPGSVLNQFSLDEYNGNFRVATGRFAVVGGSPTRSNDVYVLDLSMNQVSALRNIAPGENIYAVRFVGSMGYVVTFMQIDPLFVISFKDIAKPVILSELKVSGYSDYLHPLPGGYLIGVGKDAVPSSTIQNVAFYLGLKLSLFRVFDNGTSIQVSKLLIGDRGTDSPVLTDHLAFTFDSTRNVTVIPLTLYKVTGTQSNCSSCLPPYGDPVWQGVYVIHVNSSGFNILGRVSQYSGSLNFGDSANNSLQIDRSVIIGDYLYTISQGEVMVNTLSSFSTVATVPLPQ
ncbi:MAG TPA: beta-propeller domain-containing protein [Nitrososphaerales archaeon]|nr:beta-propeller domain-containing protein [Nitrososphaerales archaeon]